MATLVPKSIFTAASLVRKLGESHDRNLLQRNSRAETTTDVLLKGILPVGRQPGSATNSRPYQDFQASQGEIPQHMLIFFSL